MLTLWEKILIGTNIFVIAVNVGAMWTRVGILWCTVCGNGVGLIAKSEAQETDIARLKTRCKTLHPKLGDFD